jgi:hypothetical protein
MPSIPRIDFCDFIHLRRDGRGEERTIATTYGAGRSFLVLWREGGGGGGSQAVRKIAADANKKYGKYRMSIDVNALLPTTSCFPPGYYTMESSGCLSCW